MSTAQRFTVRRLRSAEEVAEITSKAAKLGWKPGALDHVSYFAADNTGFFVGELNGRVISCISAVKYSEDFAFVGQFIVDEPYRGWGYGLATWKTAITSLPEGCNIGGDAIEHKLRVYKRLLDVKPYWRNKHVIISAEQGSLALEGVSSDPATVIRPVSEVSFSDILEYDTSVGVYPRPAFLEKWTSAQNCCCFVATNSEEAVVGYTVVRKTLRPQDGWKIGPLYADTSKIAQSLYQAVFKRICMEEPTAIINITVPFGDLPNPDALEIIMGLSPQEDDLTTSRVYKHGIPSGLQLQKIFGATCSELH